MNYSYNTIACAWARMREAVRVAAVVGAYAVGAVALSAAFIVGLIVVCLAA